MTVRRSLPLASYPGMNRFVLDRLAGRDAALRLLPNGSLRDGASRNVADALKTALIESNARWGIDVRADVDAWAGGARMFIAGQQVGVAGGPLYTLSKIATLLRMKRDAEAQGERAVAFFWLATEDHDFAEVAQLAIPARFLSGSQRSEGQADLVTLSSSKRGNDRSIVGPLVIPDSLRKALVECLGNEPRWLREGITFQDSFAELLAETFGSEIVLVDSLLPELRSAGKDLFALLSSNADAAQRALAERTDAITAAGYTPQITAREGEAFTLFFRIDDSGDREAIATTNGIAPERVSTSALTRPLLQDAVLEPDVFVGGPAEVAYYAQVAALHELAGVRLPHVALRGHALLAEPRVLRAMERLDVDPADCFRTADELLAPAERDRIGRLQEVVSEGEGELMRAIERVRELALPADRSLAKSIERSVRHIEYHYRKLAERSTRAVVRRDRERYAAAQAVVEALYPDALVQERVVSWYAYVAKYGRNVVDSTVECVGPDRTECALIAIV